MPCEPDGAALNGAAELPQTADMLISLLLGQMADELDHPEIWRAVPAFIAAFPDFRPRITARFQAHDGRQEHLLILHALALAADNDLPTALAEIEPLAVIASQSALVQGAVFHLQSLGDPENPRYQLQGKICTAPFQQLDVLENSAHQCCASWLHQSAGDLSAQPWREVWNSAPAQAIRASVLDGSYRYCSKTACPKIQANTLPPAAELAASDPFWADVIAAGATRMERGPAIVNLAYDRTCNLSCPSCRSERYAANDATRARYTRLQDEAILPMLQEAEVVFVTGSGDPFASKNFRNLMHALTPQAYPRLRFQIMTNAMLLTPAQWDAFPALHGRVKVLKISTDAATGPTHEKLRRGAHWPTMLENMTFAGQLAARGDVEYLDITYTVQHANFREMGDAVDLAKHIGASGIHFVRITNWGTFTPDQYREKAVFLPGHPDHAGFLECMRDPRLLDPMVLLGDLEVFAGPRAVPGRAYLY